MLAGNVVESHKLAEMVSKVLPGAVGLPNRGVKSARFYVMYYGVMSNFPSILVELGYLSNPEEEAKLGNPEWRQKAASAIADAVVQYLEDLERRYPEGRGWSR
jgi:N-acetylmuramoyl-L-alanine amidase